MSTPVCKSEIHVPTADIDAKQRTIILNQHILSPEISNAKSCILYFYKLHMRSIVSFFIFITDESIAHSAGIWYTQTKRKGGGDNEAL